MPRPFPQRLNVDLDGILVDFNGPVLKKYGKSGQPEMWTIYDACGVTRDELFDNMPYEEWLALPKLPECDEILELAEEYFRPRDIFILSSPLFHKCDPQVLAAKHHWIWDNLPAKFRHQSFIGVSKYGAAQPNAALLDDHVRQTTEFFEEGGSSILLPKRWNTPNWDQPLIPWLRSVLEIWKEGVGFTYHFSGHGCEKKAIAA